jgi:aryl-alcohol dehydrogenase-like predicted oxidoreductase
MEYRTLGNTGLEVSSVCFGTWRFSKESSGTVETDRETAHELLDTAVDTGINFIDTANSYGDPPGTAETWIGEWLEGRDREDLVIASKCYFGGNDGPNRSGLSRKTIRAEIEGTLDRLGTDYIDLYYIHRWDESTPIRETVRTLQGLVDDGKVHYLGASSMAAWKLTKALWTADRDELQRFDVTQPRFNAAYRDPVEDYLDLCADQDLAVCPYSPLEGGFLTGKYQRSGDAVESPDGSRGDLHGWDQYADRQWRVLDAVEAVADEVDATPAQVALRWLIDGERFTCVPIVGARTPEQLRENAGAADVHLDAEQHRRIDVAYHEDAD